MHRPREVRLSARSAWLAAGELDFLTVDFGALLLTFDLAIALQSNSEKFSVKLSMKYERPKAESSRERKKEKGRSRTFHRRPQLRMVRTRSTASPFLMRRSRTRWNASLPTQTKMQLSSATGTLTPTPVVPPAARTPSLAATVSRTYSR